MFSEQREQVTRDVAINRLRQALLTLTDDDHSICRIAAAKNFFCGGFRRFSDTELRERYDWLAYRYPAASRHQIEELANRWQLARQVIEGLPLACDVQQMEHDSCGGWDDFSNQDLSTFCHQILGESLIVD